MNHLVRCFGCLGLFEAGTLRPDPMADGLNVKCCESCLHTYELEGRLNQLTAELNKLKAQIADAESVQ